MKDKIIGYYKEFDFPKEYDSQFYENIEKLDMSEIEKVLEMDPPFEYVQQKNDPFFNLALILAHMEKGYENFEKAGVPREIAHHSLSDVLTWSANYYKKNGKVGHANVPWAYAVAGAGMFKLDRLQFQFGKAYFESKQHDLKIDDDVINIHIPEGPGLTPEACQNSVRLAKEFFKKHFPDYNYKAIICTTWLLNPTLLAWVKPDSNIAHFMRMFDIVKATPSTQGRQRVFGFDHEQFTDAELPENTSLQKKMKEFLLNGGTLMSGSGVLK